MKRWEIINKIKKQESRIKNQDIINILLENRGLKTKQEIDEFLNTNIETLTTESVGIDKDQVSNSIERIKKAIDKKEQIVIYGDYDVDGITASAILWETFFFNLNAQVTPYIPHRVDEGYGLSIKGIDNLLTKFPDTKLIVTVDNGIVAHEAVAYANKKRIDTIITDHHVKGETLPDAYSIVHTTALCGAGVAYMLTKELKRSVIAIRQLAEKQSHEGSPRRPDLIGTSRDDNLLEDSHLELAALGTIADLVSLKGANRAIVKFGLKKLSETKRPGLLALYEEAGIDKSKIGAYEVGHIIAPRLNATGRMESAMDSLRLICTKDPKKAMKLASLLGGMNRERQEVMKEAAKHASHTVHARNELKKLLVVNHDTYPEGVIGLIAGRLVEEFYRPSIVISKGEKISKGSVRSINGFNIIEFLRQSSEYFINIGGHPMAAGFTIETHKIEKMQKAFEKLSEEFDENIFTRVLKIDCELPFHMISQNLYQNLQSLSPFGMSNMEPVFMTKNVEIIDMNVIGKAGNHLKMTIIKDGLSFEAICFGMGKRSSEIVLRDRIDIVFTIDENTWKGNIKIQLKIKDFKKSEAIVKEEEVG